MVLCASVVFVCVLCLSLSVAVSVSLSLSLLSLLLSRLLTRLQEVGAKKKHHPWRQTKQETGCHRMQFSARSVTAFFENFGPVLEGTQRGRRSSKVSLSPKVQYSAKWTDTTVNSHCLSSFPACTKCIPLPSSHVTSTIEPRDCTNQGPQWGKSLTPKILRRTQTSANTHSPALTGLHPIHPIFCCLTFVSLQEEESTVKYIPTKK